jgi:hypothetical protein
LAFGCRATERKVSTHSPGKALVVYEIRRHVFPTAPSPTTTHLIACILTGSCSHLQRKRDKGKAGRRCVVKRVSSAHNVRCEHNELANSARWERVHGRKECSSESQCRVSAKPIVEAVVRACHPSNPRPPPPSWPEGALRSAAPPLNHRVPPCRSLSLRSHAHIHTRVASPRHPHRAHPQQDGGAIAQQRRGLLSRNIPPPCARAEEGRCHPTRAMGKGLRVSKSTSEFHQLVCAWPGPTAGVSGGGARVRQHRVCMRLMCCV